MSCQRCGQPLAPNTPTCPRCGAPVAPPMGWSQPQPSGMGGAPFGVGGAPSTPYGAPPASAPGGFGAAQQPPRFSAGSLISDGDLPEWLREGAEGQGAPQPPAWGAPAQPSRPAPPPMGQGWPQPAPAGPDIASQYTVRQPSVGQGGPAAPQNPYGQQPGYPPQQQPAQGYPTGYPAPGYSQQPPAQPGYPQPPAYPQQPPAQPGYPQQQQAYPQPGGSNYGYPAYPQQPQQPITPPAQVNAFPSIEQAGSAYTGPQVGGMAGHALLDQRALPNWLAGGPGQPGMGQAGPRPPVPSGMQARSLVDDQALPKWLRDQPDDGGRQNVSEWIGASAAQEPMPSFLSEAYAQAQVARAPQPPPNMPPSASSYAQPSPYAPNGAPGMMAMDPDATHRVPAPMRAGQGGYADESALPDWLRAQAAAAPQGAAMGQPAQRQEPAGGFAASDLIDPSALPAWVTQQNPAPQEFSSTHGWSAAISPQESSFGLAAQGYDGDAFDGGAQSAAGQIPWDDAPWDSGAAQDDMGRDWRGGDDHAESSYGRGRPLAAEELPPWLRNSGGQAAGGRMAPPSERNPWAGAGEPMEPSGGAWDEGDAWDERGGHADDAWDDAPNWDDGRRGGQQSEWGYAEPSAGWGEPEPRSARGDGDRRRRMDPDEQRGESRRVRAQRPERQGRGASRYADDDYGAPYDNGYDQGYEQDDEEPSDRQRGRGWLGFLRRDKH